MHLTFKYIFSVKKHFKHFNLSLLKYVNKLHKHAIKNFQFREIHYLMFMHTKVTRVNVIHLKNF